MATPTLPYRGVLHATLHEGGQATTSACYRARLLAAANGSACPRGWKTSEHAKPQPVAKRVGCLSYE
jgi:hypothetical protein